MSLERKDLRLKLTPELHRELASLADLDEKEPSDYAISLLERAIFGEAHIARVRAERVARWGRAGKTGEDQGSSGKARKHLRSID